jgi:hypothetical protein
MPEEILESPVAKPKSFREARTLARNKRHSISQEADSVISPTYSVPPEMFGYIFNLQGHIEQQGAMDYRKYAEIMWEELVKRDSRSSGFEVFRENMIVGLHQINMRDLIFPHLSKNLEQLIEAYQYEVKSVNIWSTGDVLATGYQPGKIDKSGIIRDFISAVARNSSQGKRDFVKEKTAYLVDDDKFSRLVEFAETKFEENPEQQLKIVLIEDSSGNFAKARKALDDKFGAGKTEVIPIWFVGSREGLTQADSLSDLLEQGSDEYWGDNEAFEKKKTDLNAIATFGELLDKDRFRPLLNGAHVMVDFDGVVCDNVKMRQRQASVIYNSLLNGVVTETGDRKELVAQMVNSSLPK